MGGSSLLIARGSLRRDFLAGQVALVTGAGRGIGYETARALAWLGARVILAEIDQTEGAGAAADIAEEMGEESVLFVHCDIGDEGRFRRYCRPGRSVSRVGDRLAHRPGRTAGEEIIVLGVPPA